MLSLFANPFAMIAGVLFVSSPIIIHLINRMRFKKIPWAAMEFLLKSQKRARRKMIIEQMLLLFLRCLLCLLAGLLLARFIGCEKAGAEGQNTLHVVLIDDTLSTTDSVRGEDGQTRDVFEEAKRLITQRIATPASQATNPQYFRIVRLSELDQPRNFGRLNAVALGDVETYLAPYKASFRHINLIDGLRAVRGEFESERTMKHVLHVVSDFRSIDWGEQHKNGLTETFEELKKANVEVHLLDAVAPERSVQQKLPLSNDNLAVIEVAPDAKIVAKFQPVEFTVKVKNFSNSEKKNIIVRVRVNGVERPDGLMNFQSVTPNSEAVNKFVLNFDRNGTDDEVAAAVDKLSDSKANVANEERDQLQQLILSRFPVVSVHLEGEVSGVAADNIRYTTLEVRDRVPILIVDNSKERTSRDAESFFLQKMFVDTIKGYDVQVKNIAELETLNLHPYVSIYVCNVPKISAPALKNLEEYVRSGGGLAFFMGPAIKSDVINDYNERLYRKGEGVFPVPLDRVVGVDIPEAQRNAEKLRRMFALNKKLLVTREMHDHPALEKLYKDNRGQAISDDEYERFFNFVILDRYAKIKTQELQANAGDVDTLIYLQNTNPMDNYTPRVNAITEKLPIGEAKWEKYAASLTQYRTDLRRIAASSSELYQLAQALEAFLDDSGNEELKRPSLKPFWAAAENRPLFDEVKKLLDEVKYGDPLYVAKKVGQGRVVAFMSSAGPSWNDLEGFGRPYYPPLIVNMQGYLASSGTDANLVLGKEHEFVFDKDSYDSKMRQLFLTGDEKAAKPVLRPLGESALVANPKTNELKQLFTQGKDPGIYLFRVTERRSDAPADVAGKADFRLLPFNVDALAEGNLIRADSDTVTQISQAPLHTASDDKLPESLLARRRDFSENPWIYLIFLLVLLAEQAMAVRLSFNSKAGSDRVEKAAPAMAGV
jgi:uncharacterized membrane protein